MERNSILIFAKTAEKRFSFHKTWINLWRRHPFGKRAKLSWGDDYKLDQMVLGEGAWRQERRQNDGEITVSCSRQFSVSPARASACKYSLGSFSLWESILECRSLSFPLRTLSRPRHGVHWVHCLTLVNLDEVGGEDELHRGRRAEFHRHARSCVWC